MAFLLVTAALATAVSAAPGSVCGLFPYNAILPLSKNFFAQSFCSNQFPVAPVVVTASTSVATTTRTIQSTVTISATVTPTVTINVVTEAPTTVTSSTTMTQTNTITSTTATTVSMNTATVTRTSTIVTGAGGRMFKRGPEPTAAPLLEARAIAGVHGFLQNAQAQIASAQFNAVYNFLSPFIQPACACIAAPKTLSATPTVTVSAVLTNTVSSTTTLTSPTTTTLVSIDVDTLTQWATVSATVTTTSLFTATATVGATATAVLNYNICGKTISAPGSGSAVAIRCGQAASASGSTLVASGTTADFLTCLSAADNNNDATSFSFQYSTMTCNIYTNSGSASTSVANSDFAYGYFWP